MFGPYAEAIRRSAAKYGIPPDVLAGLLSQESGFNPKAVGDNSNSFGMGQFNTRGALADFGLSGQQVLAMEPERQIDLTAEFLARKIKGAGGDVWAGVRAYNGGGDPNYVANVRRRIPTVDVRMAATGELPPRMAVPGNPMTGMAGPERGPDLDAKTLDVLKTFLGEEKDRKPKLWEDPLFQMGLGILATPTGTGSPMMGIARGMQTGMAAAQAAQQAAQENSLTAIGKKLFAIDLAQRQVGISGLSPAQQVAAVSNTKQYMSPDGTRIINVYERRTPDGRAVQINAATDQPVDVTNWRQIGALSQSDAATGPKTELREFLTDAAKSKTAQSISTNFQMIGGLDALYEKMKGLPHAIGTPGAINRGMHGAGGSIDQILNTALGTDWHPGEWAAELLSGPDGSEVYNETVQYLQTIARTLVDPSGPLANQEQQRAAELAGLSKHIMDALAKPLSPQQALSLFKYTRDRLKLMDDADRRLLGWKSYDEELKERKKADEGTTPPKVDQALPTKEEATANFMDLSLEELGKERFEALTPEQRAAYLKKRGLAP